MAAQVLERFFEGPLSERQGGSARERELAVEYLRRDRFGDEDEAEGAEESREKLTLTLPTAIPLFSYQREVVSRLHEWMEACNGGGGALVSLPTGAGKTRTATWFCRELIERGRVKRVLWIAPAVELVEQAVSCIKDMWDRFPGTSAVEVVVNDVPGRGGRRASVTVALCTAQLASKRLAAVEKFGPDVVVFDEAHQAVARTFRAIVRHVLRCGAAVVGLSATPGRSVEDEGEDLRELFGNTLITSKELGGDPVGALIKRGVLSKLQVNTLGLPAQWDSIRVRRLDARTLSVDELALNRHRFWSVVEAVAGLGREARTIVFGGSLAHCYALAGAIRARGVRVGMVSNVTSSVERREVLRQFSTGDVDVVVNKRILATGYDCPNVTDVILTTPVRSSILWEQILGRVSRGPAVGGGDVGRVWEFDDHRLMHKRVLSYARFLGQLW